MNPKNVKLKAFPACAAAWIILSAAVIMPDVFAASVWDSLITCAEKLIPSVFTFAVLSGYLSANGELPRFLTDWIGRLWGLGESGARAAFFALFAGFPIGALSAGTLLDAGAITKEEAERIVGFCSNAGLPFLLGFVGIGVFGNIRAGVCLFVSQTLASVLLGILLGTRRRAENGGELCTPARTGFVFCVRNACGAMLNTCGFVCFFGVLLRAFDEISARLSLPSWLHIPAACILELSSACSAAASLGSDEGLLLAAVSVGFTGVCVILQEKALCPEIPIGALLVRRVYMSALTVANTLLLRPLFGI